ncbi:NADP dehydrogenase [ubiquinone] iron-sulfur protein 2, mitochondrial [Plakobranchus ocellatus]|uniref:NADP dehydrogenase [ubiquinone] iron-sulfur protein 2, mitochondrial n=1 Tax=Plakobranchus ocellatus TaxID=259542 RepID=A0AAV3Y3B9_9GAST|nr:NADP dehydrogenase [ubiquinone] iron-sulfur protein 2, mitochondrial [Plakobranchus ocellatus]
MGMIFLEELGKRHETLHSKFGSNECMRPLKSSKKYKNIRSHCACTFPTDLTSTWRSSRWDDMTFTSSQVTVASITNVGTNVVFDCESATGSKYLIRSVNTVVFYSINLEVVACLDMTQLISGVKYLYYHATDQTSAAAITCPDPLLANFAPYTVTKSSGATSCGTSGSINICSHTTSVVVDYSSCSEVIYYSIYSQSTRRLSLRQASTPMAGLEPQQKGPADLRVDSLSTVPPTPPLDLGCAIFVIMRIRECLPCIIEKTPGFT